jgi:hypothetical protein
MLPPILGEALWFKMEIWRTFDGPVQSRQSDFTPIPERTDTAVAPTRSTQITISSCLHSALIGRHSSSVRISRTRTKSLSMPMASNISAARASVFLAPAVALMAIWT